MDVSGSRHGYILVFFDWYNSYTNGSELRTSPLVVMLTTRRTPQLLFLGGYQYNPIVFPCSKPYIFSMGFGVLGSHGSLPWTGPYKCWRNLRIPGVWFVRFRIEGILSFHRLYSSLLRRQTIHTPQKRWSFSWTSRFASSRKYYKKKHISS